MAEARPGRPAGSEQHVLGGDATHEASGTSHISIIDSDGNALAMTTTIESAFGSGRWAAGFLLNNELTDFSFRPSQDGRAVANRIEPGKRPRSSMSPTIVLGPDGHPHLVTGSAGGARIIPYVLKTIVGVIDWKLDAAAAVALPNFGSRGTVFELEQAAVGGIAGLFQPTGALGVLRTALDLKPYGHSISVDVSTSGTQLIVRREDGTLEGAADPRREGIALGD
jgi:gamma-glutamyltranspeptidase/glutathione hydrolase